MTRIVVTGASGFVGRAVCERALHLGMKVRGTYRSLSSRAEIPAGVEPVHVPSIDRETRWESIFRGAELVVHLAGRVHMVGEDNRSTWDLYREVNVEGTRRLATSAVRAGIRRLLYLSTIKVNGEKTDTGVYTEQNPPNPVGAYAVSKWEAERALADISHATELKIVVLRPPLVYGVGVTANFSALLQGVYAGIPFPFARILNERSLVYVKNLADAILVAATHPSTAGQTYLVSDGHDVSTPDLIRALAQAMDRQPRLFACPPSLLRIVAGILRRGSQMDRLIGSLVVDSTKFCRDAGWLPPYTLFQGLEETVDWYLHSVALAAARDSNPASANG